MLVEKVQQDLREAQLARDEIKVSTLRLLLAEIKNSEIQKGGSLTDEDIIAIVQKEVKKRKEAAAGFRQGGREQSAQKEEAELQILEGYLPAQIDRRELTAVIDQSIKEIGATSLADMGKVMGTVMEKIKGRADGTTVSNIVKEKLS